ncbi:NAD(P)H-dependent oxidoreductase [Rhizobiales bacterium]|uniref:FMN-dependent NADH-azoreductase n=1 Tax=Hongsoonwoonella zoysiae TaxID=2821844 RepID=UPI001560154B|nr:NAD(P)H-dependent oxidoreductase [Hongsoonwoonella zoysiae]NRG17797.1 NAD(P)H-dependent oxidoreductase [Hongsoonwoonella zoysiae]
MDKPLNILQIESSARKAGSVTRDLAQDLVSRLAAGRQVNIVRRDVSPGLPVIDDAWVAANFTDPAERTGEQKARLSLSDELVAELKAADILVIGAPVYNFGIPASLKAWVDLIARARETFRYTENGPVGLLEGKKAYVVMASGGTQIGSEIDFASGYLRHVLGFIGIGDVEIIAAERLMASADSAVANARASLGDAAQRFKMAA